MDEEIILRLPQDINKLCRTCMTITENILCHNILLIENNTPTLAAEMLQTCSLANIFSEDDMPKSICEDCTQKLEIAYNYKLQCQQTEKSLREILNLSAESTKETKKSKVGTPELLKTETTDSSEIISDHIQISTKGVTLYENNSNTNFIDNSIEFDESVLKLEILLEEKGIVSDNNITGFSALSSQSSESSSQNDVLKLIEERKLVQNSSENNLEADEINSLIQERKLCNSTVSYETSNEFIKKELFSEDETLGEHACEYCYMSFTNYDDLINHLQECDSAGNKSVLEKLLKLENESMDNVEFYEEDANENFPPYECKVCGVYFKSKYARNGHMSTHVSNHEYDSQSAELRCDLCSKVYVSEAKLATHFQKHAIGLRKDTDESTKQDTDSEVDQIATDSEGHSNDRVQRPAKAGDVTCEICNSGFQDEINLVRHLKKHGMQICVCKICLRRFDNAMKLKEHMKSHWTNHAGKVYKCPICKEQFPSAVTLRNHAAAHLDENYECKKCKRSFNNKFSYEKHMKQHSEPRYLCSLCGKQYFSSVTLACHIRSHNNEKPFVCSFCKKGFSSRATLSVHKRIHSSFKPYICNYCGYSCRQSGDLAMHIRTHTGVKPYTCTFPNCDRKFTTSSQRKEHYRRHTNERNHKCPVCQKAFLESKTLKVHMLTHTGEKPHTCEVCGKRFRRTHHLSNHMKGHRDNLKL